MITLLSRHPLGRIGNGKRHCTPLPWSLRKIKRVSFNVFLGLKELVNGVKVVDLITPRGNQKKSKLSRKKPGIVNERHANEYEPSTAIRLFNSPPWQWHRVSEWHRDINDTGKKLKGHMITE